MCVLPRPPNLRPWRTSNRLRRVFGVSRSLPILAFERTPLVAVFQGVGVYPLGLVVGDREYRVLLTACKSASASGEPDLRSVVVEQPNDRVSRSCRADVRHPEFVDIGTSLSPTLNEISTRPA